MPEIFLNLEDFFWKFEKEPHLLKLKIKILINDLITKIKLQPNY